MRGAQTLDLWVSNSPRTFSLPTVVLPHSPLVFSVTTALIPLLLDDLLLKFKMIDQMLLSSGSLCSEYFNQLITKIKPTQLTEYPIMTRENPQALIIDYLEYVDICLRMELPGMNCYHG